jgi:cytochrome c oxidase accessory protein FixG
MTPPLGDTGIDETSRDMPLFAARQKVYPRRVKGPIRNLKWAVLILCLALYYIGPWLRWDRGPLHPAQALLVDMPARRAYFFAVELWPEEVYYLAGLLIVAAVGLFFVTSLFGRMWCGFTCPQTAWTDLFMWVERLIEGDRVQRMRLDLQPLSVAKLGRKTAKHLCWLLLAAATGGAWVMYFNDAPTVLRQMATLQASTTVYFFFGLFTATTYLLAGWAREQVCTYMCPWPRFQSAMVDDQTLTVTYRDWRGEPRGKHHKGADWGGHGDCVDCLACVAVCPTGIDIRDGLQLECIGCGLCIDACNDIMRKVERPPGLIAFDTPASRVVGEAAKPLWDRLVRPRTVLYALVLVAALAAMAVMLHLRTSLTLTVLADRAPLFVTLSDGSIRNSYTLKIENRDPESRLFIVAATGLPEATLSIIGAGEDAAAPPAATGITVAIKGDGVGTFRAFIHAARQDQAEVPLTFTVYPQWTSDAASYVTTFRGPAR